VGVGRVDAGAESVRIEETHDVFGFGGDFGLSDTTVGAAIRILGIFPSSIFLGVWEDIDLAWRGRASGFMVGGLMHWACSIALLCLLA
jgi:hypothetical protein